MFNNFFQRLHIKIRSVPVRKRIKNLGKQIPVYFHYSVPLDNIKINTLNMEVTPKELFNLEPIVIKVVGNGRLDIDELIVRSGCYISAREPIKIGKYCFLNSGCSVLARAGIEIGDNLMCGDNVYIRDNDGHHLTKDGKEILPQKIKIGNSVWIGKDAIILKGVTIGNNVVIGAGSIVTKDIPPNCIAAGNPAKVIYKGKIDWSR